MMLKWISNLIKRFSATSEVPEINKVDIEKILKELEKRKEMRMLVKDFQARSREDKGGSSASSPISSP